MTTAAGSAEGGMPDTGRYQRVWRETERMDDVGALKERIRE